MNIKSLTMALRNKATELSNVTTELSEVDVTTPQQDQTLRDAAELIRVLARLVEGRPIAKAFGAPVDQDKLIEQYRITCEAQQQTIERLRGIVQRAEAED